MSKTTKGASNRYGNSRGSSKGHPTKHINYAWAKAFNSKTISGHFAEHGAQIGSSTIKSYAAKAVSFANTVDRKNNVSFVDRNGSTYKYSKKTNEFVVVTKTGIVVTYFKPKGGYGYYLSEKKERAKNGKKK
ncbi:MAG: hypothetical protein IKE21_03030 [Erysipelotrichaceae bacterium]|nr:hypothetical protein [Erysipelotrichaceae bacterium]